MEPLPPPPDAALLDALARWNDWGTGKPASGHRRDVTGRLAGFLDTPEVVALAGPRRAGKTTVMFQLMDDLRAAGVPSTALLHVNFEEPGLAPSLGLELLDRIWRVFRAEVHPAGRTWLFLDEIQRVPEWERWVRARRETEDVKIFVTGSSAALMSRELATLLTGRHATFRVMPLGFGEFLRFRGVELPAVAGSEAPAPVAAALSEYLRWGGFPEVVLAGDEIRKEILLKQYFDDLLFKDVAVRHRVRDLETLRSLAVHLLTQTASLVTYQRLADIFGVSLDLVRAYCGHLEEAFLVTFLPFWSLKAGERRRRPQKVHAVDTGLRNAVCLSASADRGRLAETAVAAARGRDGEAGLYYWQGRGEVDLVVRRANRIVEAVQVVGEGLENPEVRERELAALAEARGRFPEATSILVAGHLPAGLGELEGVRAEPLWRRLLA